MLPRAAILAGLLFPLTATVAHSQSGPGALQVRHVHIWVMDVNRTKAFYQDKLGLKVSGERPGQSVEFEGGSLWFGKWQGSGKPSTSGITIGIGAASVQAAYDALKQKGVDLPHPPAPVRDEWHFMLHDPDGYEIEIEGGK